MAEVYWTAQHKDGRFTVHTATGTTILMLSNSFSVTNGTTLFAPQNVGALVWGNAGAPNQVANVYDGAYKTWNKLKTSNRMLTGFSGVSIRAFSTLCPTSCANGQTNIINLDPNSAFSPQARVMHEMGHIASYDANFFKIASDYCYPSTGTNCGWGGSTQEWKSATFEEGFASFVAAAALYSPNAPAPHDCLSTTSCTTNSSNIETSPYAGTGCVANQDRWQLSVLGFLWDIYDSVQENYVFAVDYDSRQFGEFFDILAAFPNGTSDHEDDEAWNSARTALDDRDGRSPEDFNHWFNASGFNAYNQRAINCNP